MIVRTPSRIHLTLIDLEGSLGRVDGGIGIALEEPHILLEVEKTDKLEVEGRLKDKALSAARAFLSHYRINGGARIAVKEAYPEHIGLGSGTQLSLAVARALSEIYDIKADTRELAYIVGRGGTSGIGTAAFEKGGFIVDGGHSTEDKPYFLPSRASRVKPAPVILRRDFPDWQIALIFPNEETRISGKTEVNIFNEFCPLPANQVERLSRIILMQLLPALVEDNIGNFGRAINSIQEVGFKAVEVGLQSRAVMETLRAAQKASFGAGLSSFGPVIYALVDDKKKLENALRDRVKRIIFTKASNKGADVCEAC